MPAHGVQMRKLRPGEGCGGWGTRSPCQAASHTANPWPFPVLSGSFSLVIFSSSSPRFEERPHVILSSFPPPHRPPLLSPSRRRLGREGPVPPPTGTLTFPWLPGQSLWAPRRAGSPVIARLVSVSEGGRLGQGPFRPGLLESGCTWAANEVTN